MDWRAYVHQLAGNSKDPSTRVGAVVVSGGYAVGSGWNHFPPGVPDAWWEDREKKYRAVIHAEVAALVRAGILAQGATMVVTHHPCQECAKAIVAAGIRCVVCPPGPWRDDPGVIQTVENAREMLEICGVEVVASGSEH
jgi:dCMP deaminase